MAVYFVLAASLLTIGSFEGCSFRYYPVCRLSVPNGMSETYRCKISRTIFSTPYKLLFPFPRNPYIFCLSDFGSGKALLSTFYAG